jgi:hypothetical protein
LKHLFIIVFGLINTCGFAQQQTLQGLLLLAPEAMHSSMIGQQYNTLSMLAYTKYQWNSVSKSPVQLMIQAALPIENLHLATGINIGRTNMGFHHVTQFSSLFSYYFTLKSIRYAVAVIPKMQQISTIGDKLRTPDGVYNNGINHNDELLPDAMASKIGGDFDLSFSANYKKGFTAISMYNAAESKFLLTAKNGNTTFKNNRTFIASSAYKYAINKRLMLVPQATIISNFDLTQIIIAANFNFINNISAGVSFKGYNKITATAIGINFGVTINDKWKIGYQLESGMDKRRLRLGLSHDLGIVYSVGNVVKERVPRVIYNHRYL